MTTPLSRVSAFVLLPVTAVRETYELARAFHGMFVELHRAMVRAARDTEAEVAAMGQQLADDAAEAIAEEWARRAA